MQRIGVITFPGFHVMTLAAMSVFEVANSELREHRYDVFCGRQWRASRYDEAKFHAEP